MDESTYLAVLTNVVPDVVQAASAPVDSFLSMSASAYVEPTSRDFRLEGLS